MSNMPDLAVSTNDTFTKPLVITVDSGITWAAPEVIEYGQGFNIGFALKNAGTANAENVPVRILVNDEVIIDSTLEMVNAGGHYNYNYGTYYWKPGEYTIKYILDPDNVIAESNESNNTFTYSLRVEDNGKILPDLAVSTLSNFPQPLVISTDGGTSWIAPAVVEQETTFLIGYGISNTGTINAENVLYQVWVNDTIILEQTLDEVARLGSYFYCYGIYGFDPGKYTISITLDPCNTISETNKDNNSFSYTLSVPGNQNWLVKNRWTSEPLMGTAITMTEYFPIDPQTGLRYDTNCGVTGNTVVAAYYALNGYNFSVELTPEDAFYFNDILYIDGSEANARKNGTLSFAEINEQLEDFDVNSAEDVAALSLATAVLLYKHPADYSFKRLGFKSAKSEYRGNSGFWTADGKLSDDAWKMLIRNIQAKYPVITGVPDPHVIIIDGYDAETDQMHIYFNFGIANGKGYVEKFGNFRGNGWYSREECDALELTFFTYDIIPDTVAPVAGEVNCRLNTISAELTLDFMDDVGVWKKYYRTAGNSQWTEYTDSVKIESNTTVFFKACDKAKNYSNEVSYIVSGLIAPPTLEITGNPTGWTNENIVLTAVADKGNIEFFDGKKWVSGARQIIAANGMYRFRSTDEYGLVTEKAVTVNRIDKSPPGKPVAFTETVFGYSVNLDWSNANDNGNSGVKGYYLRYGMSAILDGEGYFVSVCDSALRNLAVGTYYYQVKTEDKAGNTSAWSAVQSFEIVSGAVQNLRGDINGLSWEAIPGVDSYIVEYSTENFENVISVETKSSRIDTFALPAGTYQWRVKVLDSETTSNGENITSQQVVTEPQEFVSNADGNTDVFFGNANGKWASGYTAQHAGIGDSWSGTNEQVTLTGKNKLADIYEGSTDANILLITDDGNGDALFVDDIYTSLPGTVAEQQSRIAQIDEIRAGAGDDIVDMTSQRFEYVGDGVKIYGGLGNDTIWSNNGNNTLFGDAGNDRIVGGNDNDVIIGGIGNDRMHGGGGDDIFCFGNNWGKDTVEQLAGGKITLWFEEGFASNWNADTLTYTEGANRVKVCGISADNISLKFGDDSSDLYDGLANSGCFDDAVSEKIFEVQ